MKIINLLPKEEQRQLKLDILNHQLRVFWGVVLGSVVIFIGLGFATQQYLRLAVNRVDTQIVKSRAQLESEDLKVLQQQVVKLNQGINEVRLIRGQQLKWSEVLLEIARIMPADVQLNSIQLERVKGKVVITGKGRDRDTVIDVWARVKKSDLFTDINFPLPNLEQPTDGNFTYTFYVKLDKIKQDEFKD